MNRLFMARQTRGISHCMIHNGGHSLVLRETGIALRL